MVTLKSLTTAHLCVEMVVTHYTLSSGQQNCVRAECTIGIESEPLGAGLDTTEGRRTVLRGLGLRSLPDTTELEQNAHVRSAPSSRVMCDKLSESTVSPTRLQLVVLLSPGGAAVGSSCRNSSIAYV